MILIVVATPFEAQALPNLPQSKIIISGIGAANAALATQQAILSSSEQPKLVISAGIGGAYPSSGLALGDVVVSSAICYANLGAMDGETFLDLEQLGFPLLEHPRTFNTLPVASTAKAFAERAGSRFGLILTVETVTGSLEMAHALERRFPRALAEGMEGAGVAHAALLCGVPSFEVRAISNPVGPRNKAAWDIPNALDNLSQAMEKGAQRIG